MVERAVARAARELGLGGRRVLVAVSGGVDSTVLLHVLHGLSEDLGLELSVGHVNHGLRGAESDADAAFVARVAAALGLPAAVARVDPEALRAGRSSRARPTLQEAARRARYDALAGLAARAGAAHIATAHTADDQAETVLLRLLRGASPEGLAGIPRRSPDGRIVRPLLAVSRAEVLEHARAHRIEWREDASNRSPRFARSRLREHWLPGLAREFNPRLLRALGDLAEAQQEELAWLGALVEREAAQRLVAEDADTLRLETHDWEALPRPLRRRLARHALRRLGGGRDVSRTHLDRMVDFLAGGPGGRRLELPGGLRLDREGGATRLRRPPSTGAGAC